LRAGAFQPRLRCILGWAEGEADESLSEAGGKSRAGGGPEVRGQLHEVEAHDGASLGENGEELNHFVPEEAAGFRRADGGHLRGVDAVDVDVNVDIWCELLDDVVGAAGEGAISGGREEGEVALADEL